MFKGKSSFGGVLEQVKSQEGQMRLDLAFLLGGVHRLYMYDILAALNTEEILTGSAIERRTWKYVRGSKW